MKKFLKFLFGTFTLAAAVLGVYYVVKNFMSNEDCDDDFDDLDDDFEEFDTDKETSSSDSREYVPINLGGNDEEDTTTADEEETTASYEAEEPVNTESTEE